MSSRVSTCNGMVSGPGAADGFVVLALATSGRRYLLSSILEHLSSLTRLPDMTIICGADPEDVDPSAVEGLPFPTTVIQAQKGLCHQRNAVLDLVERRWPDACILVFLDDDFVPASNFLLQALRLIQMHPDVVLATGQVIKDGIKSSGISLVDAQDILTLDRSSARNTADGDDLREVFNVYGCNMVLRIGPLLQRKARFNTDLPLYGWLEDVEFSRAVAGSGRIVQSPLLRGVHLGTKTGRTPGVKFGYSQVANPIYLLRKGHMSTRRSFVRVARNLIANGARIIAPEPWIDRRGRLSGNLMALRDLLKGRLSPSRILDWD